MGPNAAIFEPGCVVKYANNAYLLLYGSLNFPSTQQTPVFTSKDDNSFGETISGSTGVPAVSAAPAIWVYFVNFNTEVNSARIRWAQKGIQYDANPGVTVTHTVRDSFFEQCSTGIHLNLPNASLSLVNVKKAVVTIPVDGVGSVSGTMTDSPYFTEKAFLGVRKNDGWSQLDVVPDTMGAVGPNHFVSVVNQMVFINTTATLFEVGARPSGRFNVESLMGVSFDQSAPVHPSVEAA